MRLQKALCLSIIPHAPCVVSMQPSSVQGRTVVAVTSGANMNFDRIRLVSELAAVGAREEAIFVTTIPERLGSFQHFMDVALADTDIQITEFKYRCPL